MARRKNGQKRLLNDVFGQCRIVEHAAGNP